MTGLNPGRYMSSLCITPRLSIPYGQVLASAIIGKGGAAIAAWMQTSCAAIAMNCGHFSGNLRPAVPFDCNSSFRLKCGRGRPFFCAFCNSGMAAIITKSRTQAKMSLTEHNELFPGHATPAAALVTTAGKWPMPRNR